MQAQNTDISPVEYGVSRADYEELLAGKRPLSYSGCSDLLNGGYRLFLEKRYLAPKKKDGVGAALGRQFEAVVLGKTPTERVRIISDELSLITKDGRAEVQAAENEGKVLIRQFQFDALLSLRMHLYENGRVYTKYGNACKYEPKNNVVLEAFFDPNAQQNKRFGFDLNDPAEYWLDCQRVLFRGEADIFSPETNMIVDLKISTDDRRDFPAVAYDFNYDLQAAIYSHFLGCDNCGLLVYHEPTHKIKTYQFQNLESGRDKLKRAVGIYLELIECLQKEHLREKIANGGDEPNPTMVLYRAMLSQTDFELQII